VRCAGTAVHGQIPYEAYCMTRADEMRPTRYAAVLTALLIFEGSAESEASDERLASKVATNLSRPDELQKHQTIAFGMVISAALAPTSVDLGNTPPHRLRWGTASGAPGTLRLR
jgi:hypothetical protein